MNRGKLSKIAMLMASPNQHERVVAMNMANKFLEKNGLTWADLIMDEPGTANPKIKRKQQAPTKQYDHILEDAILVHETRKAALVDAKLENGSQIEIWIPKSQMDMKGEDIYISSWILLCKNDEIRDKGIDSELKIIFK